MSPRTSIYPADFNAPTTLMADNLVLRKIDDRDLEHVFEGLSHPDVVRYYDVQFATLEATREQMRFFEDLVRNDTGLWWAICNRSDGEFLGAAGFNNKHSTHRRAEIGFWLLPRHWGRGIMQRAVPEICTYGFDRLGLHRIEAFVESENENCKKLMGRLGFHHDGTMRDCEVKNGRFISVDIYSKLRNQR